MEWEVSQTWNFVCVCCVVHFKPLQEHPTDTKLRTTHTQQQQATRKQSIAYNSKANHLPSKCVAATRRPFSSFRWLYETCKDSNLGIKLGWMSNLMMSEVEIAVEFNDNFVKFVQCETMELAMSQQRPSFHVKSNQLPTNLLQSILHPIVGKK